MRLFDRLKKKETMHLYTEEELDQYENFIAEQFGEYNEVAHEIVSTDIHLDVILVPPTEDSNYYKLITMGMGAYKMNVPRNLKEYELERAELVIYLPPTWDIKSGKEEDYWPIEQLKTSARVPVECNTWLGYGHTISFDEDNTPYADNTKFCSMLVLPAANKNGEALDLRMKTKGKINFYQLFPIYEEELEYKQQHDVQALLELFGDDISPIIDINRANYGVKEEK